MRGLLYTAYWYFCYLWVNLFLSWDTWGLTLLLCFSFLFTPFIFRHEKRVNVFFIVSPSFLNEIFNFDFWLLTVLLELCSEFHSGRSGFFVSRAMLRLARYNRLNFWSQCKLIFAVITVSITRNTCPLLYFE